MAQALRASPGSRESQADQAGAVLRAKLMRENARSARERNQKLLRANEELRDRLRHRRQTAQRNS